MSAGTDERATRTGASKMSTMIAGYEAWSRFSIVANVAVHILETRKRIANGEGDGQRGDSASPRERGSSMLEPSLWAICFFALEVVAVVTKVSPHDVDGSFEMVPVAQRCGQQRAHDCRVLGV